MHPLLLNIGLFLLIHISMVEGFITNPILQITQHHINSWSKHENCLVHLIADEGTSILENYFDHSQSQDHGVNVINSISTNFSWKISSTSFNLNENIVHTFYQTKLQERTCTIAVVFIDNQMSSLRQYSQGLSNKLKFMQTNSFLHETPEYILLSFAKEIQTQTSLNKDIELLEMYFYFSLRFIPICSKYLVLQFIKSQPRVSYYDLKILVLNNVLFNNSPIVNIRNGPLQDVNNVGDRVPHLQLIDHVWLEIHKNMSGTSVVTKRSQLHHFLIDGESGGPTNCNLGEGFRGDIRLCIVQILSLYLHFNLTVNHEALIPKAAVAFQKYKELQGNLLISNELDNWQVFALYQSHHSMTGHKFEWIVQSWMKDPLSFILILDKETLKQSALHRPYDLITWSLILTSVLVVSFLLTLSLWTNPNPADTDVTSDEATSESRPLASIDVKLILTKMILMAIGPIFEQNPSDITERKHKILSFRMAFGIWLLASIVISNAYTGIVISFLCSSVLPNGLPENLQQLAATTYPIYSSDTIYIPQEKLSVHYTAALIYEYVVASSLHQSEDKKYYMDILTRTLYIHNITHGKLTFLYEKDIPIPAYLNTANRTQAIKKNFVFISTKIGVKKMLDILSSNPNVLLWRPEVDTEKVGIQTAFILPRNYFSVIFKRYYELLQEAGFPMAWKEQEEHHRSRMHKNTYACWKNDNSFTWDANHYCDTQNFDSSGGQAWRNSNVEDDEFKPLPLEVLTVTFLLTFMGQGIALIGFLVENLTARCGILKQIRKRSNRCHSGTSWVLKLTTNCKKPEGELTFGNEAEACFSKRENTISSSVYKIDAQSKKIEDLKYSVMPGLVEPQLLMAE